MFCAKCGQQLPEGAAFCGHCGAAVKKPQTMQAKQPGLLWYQILLYGGILGMALIGLISSLNLLTGHVYEGLLPGLRVTMYGSVKGLQAFDTLMGLLALGLAGFAVYVWLRLRDRRHDAMKLLAFYLIGAIVWNMIYVIGLNGFVNNQLELLAALVLRLQNVPVVGEFVRGQLVTVEVVKQGLMSVVSAVLNYFLLSGNYVAMLGCAGVLGYNCFYCKKHADLFIN